MTGQLEMPQRIKQIVGPLRRARLIEAWHRRALWSHIIGVSMGGFIALEIALHYPQMVQKLVLVVTSAGGAGRVSPTREIMAVMMPIPGVEIGDGSRRICAAVSAPGFAESHPEEFNRDILAFLAQ